MDDEVLLCASESLRNGGDGIRFDVKLGASMAPAFAVRFQDRVHAYVNRCAHVPYELDWQAGKFFDGEGLYLICSTHGALYAPESGRCEGGPCGRRHLIPVSVDERDGQVYVARLAHPL